MGASEESIVQGIEEFPAPKNSPGLAPCEAVPLALPPVRLRLAHGVDRAVAIECPFTRREAKRSEAQKVGLRYERKVKAVLSKRFGKLALEGQWFKYHDNSGWSVCQTDVTILFPDIQHIAIIEIKARHCADAWWQLKRLYDPVVRCAFRPRSVSLFEITRSFDGAVTWPEPCEAIICNESDLVHHLREGREANVEVLQFRP